jgi:hypothetical protein
MKTTQRMTGARLFARRLIVFLSLLVGLTLAAAVFRQQVAEGVRWIITAAPLTTPVPPTIVAPQGAMPKGPVGLQQWLQAPGGVYTPIETSGFLLKLPGGEVIGVTTAHSLFQEDPHRQLAGVALGVNGQGAPLAEADTYYGPPGEPFAGNDFAMDYVFLKVGAVDPAQALEPDARDLPQPGERVTLFSGLGDGRGGVYPLGGTVLSTDASGVFIYMDQADFSPAGMSGSPVVSQYTGRVVGMAIGAALRHTRWLIGLHPIGHLVQTAQAAREFPRIADFRR